MNNTTQCRVERVLKRTKELYRQRSKHYVYGLTGVCFTLVLCLSQALVTLTDGMPANTRIMDGYGAVLMLGDAGGYVLIGVVAFTVGVVITVLCMRYCNKKAKNTVKEK